MDKLFPSVIQDHWTAKEVEEHFIAARAVNNKQVLKLIIAYKSLQEVHSALGHQCRDLAANKKILKNTNLQIHKQPQIRGGSHGHDQKQTEARIQEHEQGTSGTSSHELKPKEAKHRPFEGARTNLTSTGGVMPDRRHKKAPCNPASKGSPGIQDHGSKSEPSVGACQVGGTSKLGSKTASRRAKKDHDGPNARSSQNH